MTIGDTLTSDKFLKTKSQVKPKLERFEMKMTITKMHFTALLLFIVLKTSGFSLPDNFLSSSA